MKSLVTWVILFCPFIILGQCPGFNFYVNGSSLNCNPDELQLCVTIPDGSVPSGPCLQDYVIRVSYSSINFNYTDLTLAGGISLNGGWYDRSTTQDPLTTILEWEISPISTHMHGCFLGVSFGTLPTFTIELYNSQFPNVILGTQTFDFTTTPVISTDMTITDAIALQLLLDPAISSFTKQDVYIDATLTADIDYNFGAQWGLQSVLTMAPGSKIVVSSQTTLGISDTNLTTCDEDKWDGILIQDGGTVSAFGFSNINNAEVGVELLDGANLEFGKLIYTNCTYGIGSFGAVIKNINIANFSSPFFFSSIQNCNYGIRLENCNTLNLLNYIGFFNNKTGISALNTNLNISGISLNDTELNAIEAEGSMNVNLEDFTIYTSGNGIQLDNVFNTYVDDLTILDCRNGVVINESLNPTTFEIRNSDLRQNEFCDITADILPGSVGIVFNNNFGQNYNNSANYNVFLEGIGFGSANHLWSINDNDGMDARRNNVNFSSINRGVIFKNDQAISGPPFIGLFSRAANFVVSGGERNIINNNDNLVAPRSNIVLTSSQMSQISCNDNITARNSIRIFNDNSGTEIWGNEMNSLSHNYVYGSSWNTFAVTDIQDNHLNLFDLSSQGSPKAKHYGPTATEVNLSQHLIHGWNVNQGDAEYPFFVAASSDWFTTGANSSVPFCPPTPIVKDEKEVLARAILTGTKIFNQNVADAYDKSARFESNFKLYRNLLQLETLQYLDQEQAEIKSVLAKSIVSEYVEFEREYSQFINTFNEISAGLQAEVAELNAVYKEMTQLDLVKSMTNSFSIDRSQQEKYNSNQASISILESRITKEKRALDNYKNNSLTILLKRVESLPNSELSAAQNRKTIYPVILEMMQVGKEKLSSKQFASLETIAVQCIGTGGEAVLWARGLVDEGLELPELVDECLVRDVISHRSSSVESTIAISPNPTSGLVNVEFSTPFTEAITLKVYDQLGHKVLSEVVNSGTSSKTLNLSHLPSGLYLLNSNSELIPTSKILLNKD